MSFDNLLNHAPVVHTDGVITVPTMYDGAVNFIIPDKIVDFCIERYRLLNNNSPIIDPMCGVGTIPRIINQRGGNCTGVEIDISRYKATQSDAHADKIIHGNYLEAGLAAQKFYCLFTSMPFDWFKHDYHSVDSVHASKFKQLITDDGFVLLDSIPMVDRDGTAWPVARRQSEYMETHGFSLVEIIRFINHDHTDCTNESVIMQFKPRQ